MSETIWARPELPAGWTWASVEDLGAPVPHAITDGPFGSNLKTAHYTDEGPRVVRLQNIGDGIFIDVRAHIAPEHFEQLRKHEAKPGDIVIAALGEILPRACLVPDWLGPAIVKADCPRLRPHPSLNARYVVAALNSHTVRREATSIVHGVGRPRLNLTEIKGLQIPMPPRIEQDRIVARLDEQLAAAAVARAELEANINRLDLLKRSLIDYAVTGKLIDNDESAGSAADLLETIRAEQAAEKAARRGTRRAGAKVRS
jgi:type I restriction enzyme, S subunit